MTSPKSSAEYLADMLFDKELDKQEFLQFVMDQEIEEEERAETGRPRLRRTAKGRK